jgi:hypothetical protein
MKLALPYFTAASLFWAMAKTANAISATASANAMDLANSLLATEGAVIHAATLTGSSTCAGLFSGGSGVVPGDSAAFPDSGVILSSGNVADIAEPNDSEGTTTDFNLDGDSDLDGLVPGYKTHDACILEIEFQCLEGLQGSDVTFNYIFSSEEYNEWVNCGFNDVFGFFLNNDNIAVLPDGTAVSIDNVNNGLNSEFYNDNDNSAGNLFAIEADGFTTLLTAAAPTGEGLNTIKLAIADAGDQILDSWVLLQAGSFTCTHNFCEEFKGCHDKNTDKRAICHRQGKPNTLCLPAPAIAAHLAKHPEDTCGCCSVSEEKRRPDFCGE